MDLQQIEKHIISQGQALATIKGKLFNGMTEDISEIKAGIKALSESFQTYKDNRETTCPLKKEKENRGKGTARFMGLLFGTNSAIIAIVMLILKVAKVI